MNPRKDLRRGCPRCNNNNNNSSGSDDSNNNNNNNMVKEKANSIRIYDSEGYRRRAACICVKSDLEDEVSQLADGSHLYILSRHLYIRVSRLLRLSKNSSL